MNFKIKKEQGSTYLELPCREERIAEFCKAVGIPNTSATEVAVEGVYPSDRANILLQNKTFTLKTFAGGLSGKLQSGDIVSVIAPDFREQGLTVIPPELKYVEVISVTAPSGYDANTGEQTNADDDRELPSTVTLLVTPEQGNILAELEAEGKSHLSLVFRGENKQAQEFIAIQEEVIRKIYSPDLASESADTVTEPQSQKSEESHNSQTGESEGE